MDYVESGFTCAKTYIYGDPFLVLVWYCIGAQNTVARLQSGSEAGGNEPVRRIVARGRGRLGASTGGGDPVVRHVTPRKTKRKREKVFSHTREAPT